MEVPKLNDKLYTPRKKKFKEYRAKAITLKLKYEQFARNYGVQDTLPITKALLSGALTQADIDAKNETFYEVINDMFYDSMPIRELFLLDNGKELCDVIYEDCDIEHKSEMEDEEYIAYMQFLQDTLSFFLKTSRGVKSAEKLTNGSEEISTAIRQ